MREKRCLAYWIEGNKEYRLDLSPYGVRKDWNPDAIWDVASREMRKAWDKPVTCWGWEKKTST